MIPKSIIILGGGSTGLLAATYIKKYLPDAGWKISVIASSKIPIIGVGEGTTEHIDMWRKTVEVPYERFIEETLATQKFGVRFLDWRHDGHEYVHSLCSEINLKYTGNTKYSNISNQFEDRHFFWSQRMSAEPLYGLCAYGEDELLSVPDYLVYHMNKIVSPETRTLQFHFNNFALNKFLRKLCSEMNIDIIDDEIINLTFCEDGNVKSLDSSSKKYEADFFFDCSGFKKFIISKMGAKDVDFSDQLLLDSAIFFPDETEQDYMPYTLAKALDAGWFWQAPTQDRTGNGYVFSSKHITADQAHEELEKKFGKKIKLAGQVIFKSGHLDKSWIKNVCALGIASSFFEPLEAAALSTGVLQANLFCELITNYDTKNNTAQDCFNDYMKRIYKNSFEFIRIHYLNCREDTEFWRDYKNLKMPDDLNLKVEMWKQRPPSDVEFLHRGLTLYGSNNFFQVMYGLGLIDSEKITEWFKIKGKEKSLQNLMLIYDNYIEHIKQDPTVLSTGKMLEEYRRRLNNEK
jgi:tryptophan halogenase